MKTNYTNEELLARLDKEALREVLVTLTAISCYDVSDKGRERGFFRLESLFEDMAPIFEQDEAIMREANSVACELDR